MARLLAAIDAAGGWLPFDRYMAITLYEPGLGYYAGPRLKLGRMPASAASAASAAGAGSDFVTAPELTPLFGQTLAHQVAEALRATGTDEVWEFGAGTGALAQQLLEALALHGPLPRRYTIVELSGELRERQRSRLAGWGERVQWVDRWPAAFAGVLVGNEVLDAMPVRLLRRCDGPAGLEWRERGVVRDAAGRLGWSDRATAARPPVDIEGPHDYLTEIHPQAEAFVRTLGERWQRGAAFFLDYGFPEREYYHPQRHMGTLMCHRDHRSDSDPLTDPGQKDITAHVNFTGLALAAQEAGLSVLGYTSQGRFLINAGLMDRAASADLRERAMLGKLVHEHEMGELFKVLALAPAASASGWVPSGFSAGDRTHRL